MKKYIILSLSCALILSGCGKDGSHESTGGTTTPAPTSPATAQPSGGDTPVSTTNTDPMTGSGSSGSGNSSSAGTSTGTGAGTSPATAQPSGGDTPVSTTNTDPMTGSGSSGSGNSSSAGTSTGTGAGNSGDSGTTGSQPTPVCKSGPIGTYNGYIKRNDGSQVPLQLNIDIRKSGDSSIPLRASLRVGFLGGVTVGTESVLYDWTKNFLSITFSGTAQSGASASASSSAGASASVTGGPPSVQIIGTLSCGALVGGQIHGNKSGFQNVVLSKNIKTLFDDTKTEFDYAVNFASHPESTGYLTLTPRLSGFASSDTTDLPYLPYLTATIKYSGYGVTVEPFDSVLYDPLTNSMELSFTGYGIFKCPLITKDLKAQATSPALTCDVTMGASTYDTMTGMAVNALPAISLRPPRYFKGFYYPTPTLKYVVVGSMEYQDRNSKNPTDSIFPNFPVIDLKVTICDGIKTMTTAPFETVSINPINSRVKFRFAKPSAESFDMNVTYSPDFNSFTGIVPAAQTSPGAQDARYEFTALKDQDSWRTCATK